MKPSLWESRLARGLPFTVNSFFYVMLSSDMYLRNENSARGCEGPR